jgi:hypothetical protein
MSIMDCPLIPENNEQQRTTFLLIAQPFMIEQSQNGRRSGISRPFVGFKPVPRHAISWERGRFSGGLFRGELARGVRRNLTRGRL